LRVLEKDGGKLEKKWNPFSRYNRNLFLKKMEEEESKYKGGKIEE